MNGEGPLLRQAQGLSMRLELASANNCVVVYGCLCVSCWPGSEVSKSYSADASGVLQMIDLDVI